MHLHLGDTDSTNEAVSAGFKKKQVWLVISLHFSWNRFSLRLLRWLNPNYEQYLQTRGQNLWKLKVDQWQSLAEKIIALLLFMQNQKYFRVILFKMTEENHKDWSQLHPSICYSSNLFREFWSQPPVQKSLTQQAWGNIFTGISERGSESREVLS